MTNLDRHRPPTTRETLEQKALLVCYLTRFAHVFWGPGMGYMKYMHK